VESTDIDQISANKLLQSLVPCMCLTLWRPQSPYGYSYKASCARPG